MTEPTEAAEAHRLISEAFAEHDATQAEAGRVIDVVLQSATAYAAGDVRTAGALLIDHAEQDENPEHAAYILCLATVSGVGFVLDGDLIQPPCDEGETHGDVVDLAVHAANHASLGQDERLSRMLAGVWDSDRDTVLPLAGVLVSLLAGILKLASEDGGRDA